MRLELFPSGISAPICLVERLSPYFKCDCPAYKSDYDKTIKYIRICARMNGYDDKLHYMEGVATYNDRSNNYRYEHAAKSFKEAVKLNPKKEYYKILVESNISSGNLSAAKWNVEDFVEAYPVEAVAYALQAQVYSKNGDNEKACQSTKLALELKYPNTVALAGYCESNEALPGTCSQCGGTGSVSFTQSCVSCGGAGSKMCSSCFGRGFKYNGRMESSYCGSCYGKGRKSCYSCSGGETSNHHACPKCKGSGKG